MDRSRTVPPVPAASELAVHEPQTQPIVAGGDFESRSVVLGNGKSVVVDFPRDIKDVLVADPKIANAVIRSSRRAYIIGNEVGQTNIVFLRCPTASRWPASTSRSTRDLNGIRPAIQQVLPDADITCRRHRRRHHADRHRVEPGRGAAGLRHRRAAAQCRHRDTVGTGSKVVNAIVVRGRDQVMLKVTVAEVERDVIKQLGINLSGSARLRHGRGQFQQHQSVLGLRPIAQRLQHHRADSSRHRHVAGDGTGRRHPYAGRADPHRDFRRNRDFLAGGQFPVLNGFSCRRLDYAGAPSTCQPSIQFKNFGVSSRTSRRWCLAEGRISLNVTTEVSRSVDHTIR